MNNRRFFLSIFWLILGIGLLILSLSGKIDDTYNGIAGGLIVVGLLQTTKHIKYRRDPEYKEKVDIEESDERNRLISMKAWAIAGYIFIFGSAAVSLVLFLMGKLEASAIVAFSFMAMMLVYFIIYYVLKRKM